MNITKRSLIYIFSFVLFFQNFCFAQKTTENLNKFISQCADSAYLHGSILVAENGKSIYENAFGLANMEWNIPNDVDTKYRIYSMSKQFTALLVMQLVEDGKIDVHYPISRYLPYYNKDVGSKVTVHHLLTHTHGIAEGYEKLPRFLVTEPTKELILNYFNNNLEFDPGSKFRYSGLLGFTLLGAIVESVTGKSFETVLQEKILDPLDMKNSAYLDYEKIIPNKASDYFRTVNGYKHRIQAYILNANGGSCLVSNVNDLLRWDQALYGTTLLSEPFKEEPFKPQVTQHAPYYYGYGWYVADLEIAGKVKRIMYHTGGGTCIIFRNVKDHQTVILLNNLRSNKLYDIGLKILSIMHKS